jgi:hypothetical protein
MFMSKSTLSVMTLLVGVLCLIQGIFGAAAIKCPNSWCVDLTPPCSGDVTPSGGTNRVCSPLIGGGCPGGNCDYCDYDSDDIIPICVKGGNAPCTSTGLGNCGALWIGGTCVNQAKAITLPDGTTRTVCPCKNGADGGPCVVNVC